MKRCNKCGQTQDESEFRTRRKRGKIGLYSACRTCEKIYNSGVKAVNTDERYAEIDWSAENPRACVRCKSRKAFCDFAKDRGRVGGLQIVCKKCNVEVRRELRAHTRRWRIKGSYGTTPEEIDRIYEAQKGCCAICKEARPLLGSSRDSIHIDHSHITGKVRGLLCSKCNTSIGGFKDSSYLLRQAAAYLESFV